MSTATDTESPVPAREALDQATQPNREEVLAEQAKEQEAAQKRELQSGKVRGDAAKAHRATQKLIEDGNLAAARDGGPGPIGGRVDNMTKRSDADVMQGHFCEVLLAGDKDLKAAVAVQLFPQLEEDDAVERTPDVLYGVFTDVGSTDPQTGYPVTVTVLTRDEHAAFISSVPYEALKPAPQGGRR